MLSYQKKAHQVLNYYGSKRRTAFKYCRPTKKTIIEPFAGGACYSLRYHWHDVILYDLYSEVCSVWDYVINANPSEIRSLPLLKTGQSVDDLSIHQEAKLLIGYWLAVSATSSRRKLTPWQEKKIKTNEASVWNTRRREFVAQTSELVKHWKIHQRSYIDVDNMDASWFIDPPYQCEAGRSYKHNKIDYNHLADWCKSRAGQVQVCENSNSQRWLPFTDLYTNVGQRFKTTEVIWRNYDIKGESHDAAIEHPAFDFGESIRSQ